MVRQFMHEYVGVQILTDYGLTAGSNREYGNQSCEEDASMPNFLQHITSNRTERETAEPESRRIPAQLDVVLSVEGQSLLGLECCGGVVGCS